MRLRGQRSAGRLTRARAWHPAGAGADRPGNCGTRQPPTSTGRAALFRLCQRPVTHDGAQRGVATRSRVTPFAASSPGHGSCEDGQVTERPPVSLLGAAEIRRLADELDLRPTKSLGQNFVHDGNTVRRIVAAADLRSTDHVLEIGPGLGSLTLGLLDAVAAVTAVEIDPRLAAVAAADRRPARPAPGGRTAGDHRGRAARSPATGWRCSTRRSPRRPIPTALVANLPYNVAVPVLLHLLAEVPTLRRVLVMVQAEVADRLVAGPGSKIYGVAERQDSLVRRRPAGPVRSAGRCSGRCPGWTRRWSRSSVASTRAPDDRAAVFAVIDAAFAQRRKTLRSALAGWAGSPAYAETVLKRARVDPAARGEVLTVDDFARIAAALRSHRRGRARMTLASHSARGRPGRAGPGPGEDQSAPGGRRSASGRLPRPGHRVPRGRPGRRADHHRRRPALRPDRPRPTVCRPAPRTWPASPPGCWPSAAAPAARWPSRSPSRSRSPAAWPAEAPTRQPLWSVARRCGGWTWPAANSPRSAPSSAPTCRSR